MIVVDENKLLEHKKGLPLQRSKQCLASFVLTIRETNEEAKQIRNSSESCETGK